MCCFRSFQKLRRATRSLLFESSPVASILGTGDDRRQKTSNMALPTVDFKGFSRKNINQKLFRMTQG